MKLSGSERKYTVKRSQRIPVDPVWVFYEVEERGGLSRRFTLRLTHTQATRKKIEQDIAQWCENSSQKLPPDGGTVSSVDLDNVERLVDRR